MDLTSQLTQLNGQPILGGDKQPATIATCSIEALLSPRQEDDGVTKIRKAILAEKIFTHPSHVAMTTAEAAMLSECLQEFCSPLALIQCLRVIDPEKLK
ncbi:MAG: hypothetical protein AB7O62_00435 [Pirellulales bacterium]